MRKPEDLHIKVGERFERLVCESFSHMGKHNRSYFNFICDCGKRRTILGAAVKSGNTKSCGCYGMDLRKSRRTSNIHSEVTAIMLGYKRHALQRGIEWGLSREDIEMIIFNNCYYCASAPVNIKRTKNSIGSGLLYSGIDRVNSSSGYFPNNVVPCCKTCNYAKNNLSIEEFQAWAIRLGERAMAHQWGHFLLTGEPYNKEINLFSK